MPTVTFLQLTEPHSSRHSWRKQAFMLPTRRKRVCRLTSVSTSKAIWTEVCCIWSFLVIHPSTYYPRSTLLNFSEWPTELALVTIKAEKWLSFSTRPAHWLKSSSTKVLLRYIIKSWLTMHLTWNWVQPIRCNLWFLSIFARVQFINVTSSSGPAPCLPSNFKTRLGLRTVPPDFSFSVVSKLLDSLNFLPSRFSAEQQFLTYHFTVTLPQCT
jgi:hypothetical protein